MSILRVLRLQTSKDVAVNTFGTYLSIFFAGIYTVFLVRILQPGEFGILSVLLVTSYLLANILSLGMPASIYAHLPHLLRKGRGDAMEFLKSNFLYLSGVSSLILLGIFLMNGYLDQNILKLHAPWYYYAIAFIGSELYICQNFIQDSLNAAQRFLPMNIAVNLANVLKLTILVVMTLTGSITVFNVLLVMSLVGPLTVMSIIFFERKWIVKSFLSTKIHRARIKLGYTLMYFLATQLFSLASRIDILMATYFLTITEVGYYSLSQRIVLAVVASGDSITQVLSPQFATISSKHDVRKLIKHGFFYMLIPSGLFLIGSILPSSIYNLVFTAKYSSSIIITRLLSLSYIPFTFNAIIMLFFLYTVKKPKYLLICNLILLISVVSLNFVLLPYLRILSPAITYGVSFILLSVVNGLLFVNEYRKLPA